MKLVFVAILALVAAVGVAVAMTTKTGGEALVERTKIDTKQIDAVSDVQAQGNLRSVLSAATMAFTDGGSFRAAGGEQLSALEPAFTYVDGSQPSTAGNVVSIEATDQAWGAAVLSSSGTCFFVRTVGTARAFGSGDPCTGEAAMGATGSHF